MKNILVKTKLYFLEHRYQKLICTFLAIILCFSTYTVTYAINTQKQLAQSVVRLHILANSDSEYDQNIKLELKDEIITQMKILCQKETIEKDDILKNLDNIKKFANDFLNKNSIDYNATVEYGNFDFPTKKYENIIFPKGEYEAVRIILGDGNGQNWWCVMFPPLCFIDNAVVETQSDLPENLELDDNLTEMITLKDNGSTTVSFKIVEIVQEVMSFWKK